MSSSQKRKQARLNGAKAAGAKSPEGIRKSSFNAIKHGLTAKAHVLSNESQADFDQLRQEYVDRFQPRDTIETDVVDDMVGARWRLRRIAAIQTARLEIQMDRYLDENPQSAKTMPATTLQAMSFGRMVNIEKSMEVLLRYEVTYSRMYDRAMKALERLQGQKQDPEDSDSYEELRNEPPPPPEPVAEASDLRELLAELSPEQLCGVAKRMNIDISPAIRDEIDRA